MSLNVSNVQLAVSPARFEGTIYRTYLLLNGTVAASVACIPTLPDHRIAFNKLLECLQRQEQQYPVAHKHQHITTSIICDLLETQLLIRIWFKDDILSKAETTEQFRRLIQVAKALEHLHLHKIVHGHLHPGNIFITARGDATIVDVSTNMFARAFTSQEFRIPLEPSSVYQAPEALDPRQMDLRPSSDVYAFASIVTGRKLNPINPGLNRRDLTLWKFTYSQANGHCRQPMASSLKVLVLRPRRSTNNERYCL